MSGAIAEDFVQQLTGRLTPELAALLATIDAEIGPQPDPTLLPPAEGRALSERLNRRWNTDLPTMATVNEVIVPTDPILGSAECHMQILVPPHPGEGAILFIHGGGFAFCGPKTHERCTRLLAHKSSLPLLVPDYRLAPEHPFPAGLCDVVACLRLAFDMTSSTGTRRGPLLIAGDSAGANLALAAMLHEHDAGRKLPDGALLFYGVYGADFETPSYRRFRDGPGLTTAKMQRYWDWYLPDATARNNPLASPVHADEEALRALPPLHLMAAEIDPLLSDTLALAARLQTAGRQDHVHLVRGVTHGFLQMTNALDEARKALKTAASAARTMAQPG
jgi:acetyl esterase